MPGAIAPGTPIVDLTKTGDYLFPNEMMDNVLGTQDGFIRATARLHANGRDLRDPLLSPIYGDVHGLLPAILTSGTRDLYLSNTACACTASCARPALKPCSRCGKVSPRLNSTAISGHPRSRSTTTRLRGSSTCIWDGKVWSRPTARVGRNAA